MASRSRTVVAPWFSPTLFLVLAAGLLSAQGVLPNQGTNPTTGQTTGTGGATSTPPGVANPAVVGGHDDGPLGDARGDRSAEADDPILAALNAREAKARRQEYARHLTQESSQLLTLAQQVKSGVDKANGGVLSVDLLRKLQQIQDLGHKLHDELIEGSAPPPSADPTLKPKPMPNPMGGRGGEGGV